MADAVAKLLDLLLTLAVGRHSRDLARFHAPARPRSREGIVARRHGVPVPPAAVPLLDHHPQVVMGPLHQPGRQKQQHQADPVGIAEQMRPVGNSWVGPDPGNDVVPDDHDEADEVQGGNLERPDEEDDPVEHRDLRLREQDQVRPDDGGNRAAGAECRGQGKRMQQGEAHAAEDGACQVKDDIAEVAQLVVDIGPEQVQKEHVADDVQNAAVQKGIRQKLPVMPGSRAPGPS